MAVATPTVRRPSILGVGVVVWLASELMFFAGLFAAYFTLRSSSDVWPAEDAELATGRTAVATCFLDRLELHHAPRGPGLGGR